MQPLRTALTIILLLLSATGAQEPAHKNAKDKLQQALPDLMRKANIPGLQIALIENGKIAWLGEFGQKNTSSRQPVTPDTIFEAASLSKPVFAYGVMKLVEQGKLDLDVPLTTYFPKPYIEGDDRIKLITARIILSHRTGFPNWRGNGNALAIRFTPGSRFSYSGEGFVYLQKAVERINCKPLNEYMTEAVFLPLHMKSSSYLWRPDFDHRTSSGHDADKHPRDKNKPDQANAAYSLQTTAADYAQFLDAVMNGAGLKRQTPAATAPISPLPRSSRVNFSGDWDGASRRPAAARCCGTGATTAPSNVS